MIRINRILEDSILRLVAEGTLSAVWVDELEKCWLGEKSLANQRQISVDLSGVSFIDSKGRLLLKRMLCDGAQLQATGVMTRGIIEEIANDTDVVAALNALNKV